MQQRQQQPDQPEGEDQKRPQDLREYSLSEALLKRIAELAPDLKETELRVLLHFAAHATAPEFTLRESSRDIAKAIKQARSAVQRAIDSLTARKYITTRDGTAQKAAGYRLNVALTIQMSGPLRGPLEDKQAALQEGLALFEGHLVAPLEGHYTEVSGPFRGPLGPPSGPLGGPLPNKERPPARVDPTDLITDTIDRRKDFHSETPIRTGNTEHDAVIRRVLGARPEHFTTAQLTDARKWLHGYHAKMRGDGPHPPDDKILAHLLAALAPNWTPELLWRALMEDRTKPGERYGWYVAVALQRAHGIQPEEFRAEREKLRVVQKAKISTSAEIPADVLHAIATAKGMR